MAYPVPKFLILKTKKQPHFFLRLEATFLTYIIIMPGISNNFFEIKKICWMYGSAMIASVQRLSICQILMRSAAYKGPSSAGPETHDLYRLEVCHN